MPEFTSTGTEYVDEFFAHHGNKGQKWGTRRWQNLDGSLTEKGRQRYAKAKERWSDEGVIHRANIANVNTALGLTGYAGSLIAGVVTANPILAAAGAYGSIAAALIWPIKDAIQTSRDNRLATLSGDKKLRERIEDIRSDETATRVHEIRRERRWKKQLEKQRQRAAYEKEVAHSDAAFSLTFADLRDLASETEIAHSGIKGQKWGLRRFQNPDGTLTEAGRKRYAKKGTAKLISDKEKYRAQKAKWARDPASLYKHKDEYTKAELDKAMEVFASQNRVKEQIEANKIAKQKTKMDLKQSKIDYQKMKAQEKQAKEQTKQAKLQTEQRKLEQEQREEIAKSQSTADKWKKRTDKLKSVWDYAQTGQKILSDMGITRNDAGESLFGSLAASLGLKDTSIADAKKKRANEKAELEFEKFKAEVRKAQIAADQAQYNYDNPNKKGVSMDQVAQTIEEILKQYNVI